MADPLGTVTLGVDTKQGDKAVSDFGDRLDALQRQIEEPKVIALQALAAQRAADRFVEDFKKGFGDLDGDAEKFAKSVNGRLGSAFDDVRTKSRAMLDEQTKALTAMLASGGKGSQAYEKLVGEISEGIQKEQEFAKATAEADAILGALRRSASGAADAIKDIGTQGEAVAESMPEGWAEKVFKGVALASFGEALSGIEEKGGELRDTMASVQAQTGATAEEMKVMGDQADAVTMKVRGVSLAEATKTAGEAKQKLGELLDSPGLTAFSARAEQMKKAFGTETTETIEKSRTAIEAWGLEGQHAGDLVALGQQKAVTPSNDFLDTIAEYSPLMKEAGFSADEFTGTLIRGADAGVFSLDKVADAAKEAQIRLKAGDISNALKDIKTPITSTIQEIVKAGEAGEISSKDVMQRTAKAIQDSFDAGQISETMRSQLQVAVAGTPAEDLGADIYSRIFSAPIDTDAIRQQATDAGKTLDEAYEPGIFDTISQKISNLTDKAAAWAAPFVSGAGSILQTAGQVAPGLSMLQEKFGGVFKSVGESIGGSGGLLGMVSKAGPAVAGFATGPLGIAVAAGAALVAGFTLLYNKSESFRGAVDGLVDEVKEFTSQLVEDVTPVLETAGEILGQIAGIVGTVLVTGFKAWWAIIKAVYGTVLDLISGMLGFADVGNMFDAVSTAIGDGLEWVEKQLKEFSYALDGAKAGIETFVGEIGGAIDKLMHLDFSGFIDGVANAFDKAHDAAPLERNNARVRDANDRTRAADLEAWKGFVASKKKAFEEGSQEEVKAAEFALHKWLDSLDEIATTPERQAQVDQFRNDLVEMYGKAMERFKPKAAVVPVKLEPGETFSLDLTEAAKATARDVESILNGIKINTIVDDPLARVRAEYDERKRLTIQDTEVAKEQNETKRKETVAAYEKALKEAKEKGEGLPILDIKGFDEAQAALTEKLSALRLQLAADFAPKLASAFLSANDEAVRRQLDMLARQEAVITGVSVKALEDRAKLRKQITEKQQAEELESFISAMPEFQREASKLLGDAIKLGTPEAMAAAQDAVNDLVETLKASNPEIKALADKQAADRKAAEIAADLEIATARANLIPDAAERERALRLIELEKTRQAELDKVAGGAEREAEVRRRVEKEKVDIEQQYLRERIPIYDASFDFFKGFQENLTGVVDEETRKRIELEMRGLDDQAKSNRDAFDRGLIDYQTYVEAQNEIDRQRAELMAELMAGQLDAVQALLDGLAAGIDAYTQRQNEALDEMVAAFDGSLDALIDLGLTIGTVLGGTLGSALAKQEDAGEALLRAAFDILDRLVPILSAQITALALATPASVATFGTEGLILSAILTGVLKSGVALARSAAGFREGTEWTGDGPLGEPAGIVHRQEAVIRAPYAAGIREQVRAINRGEDPWIVFRSEDRGARLVHESDSPAAGDHRVAAAVEGQTAALSQEIAQVRRANLSTRDHVIEVERSTQETAAKLDHLLVIMDRQSRRAGRKLK